MRLRQLLLLTLLAGGCFPEEEAAVDSSAPEELEDTIPAPPYSLETLPPDSLVPVQRRDSLPQRPAVLLDSIRVEGASQSDRLTLVRSPAGFSPPFTTYLPSQMKVDFMASDTAPSVRFVAAFGGRTNPEAYLQVRVYRPGVAELVPRNEIEVYLRGRDPRQDNVTPSQGWPWTLAAYDFYYGAGPQQSGFMGTIGLGRHANRFFHVLAHYPAEYGDGIGPRIHRILTEWRWEDDGSWLVPRR